MASLRWLFTTDSGRLRLTWRLLGFLMVTAFVGIAVGLAMPSGLIGGATALLVGSLFGGWCLLALDGRRPVALGFHLSPAAPGELMRGLALGVVVALLVVGLMAAGGGLRWSVQEGSAAGWSTGAGAALLFFAIPAAAEEALLRGYPLQALGEAWGGGWAVAVTSVVFGALHLGNPGAGLLETSNVALAGLFLGVVYLRTLSLWWATGAHLGWNWAHGYVADVTVSGLDVVDAPLYEGVATGPGWLSGGGFGPEGSLAATIVLVTASAVCWWGPWLTPGPVARAAGALVGTELDKEN